MLVAVMYVHILLDLKLCNRTFPRVLPAWLITLDSTLGCRQGTLYKAPRNADRPLADDNVWTRCEYWNALVCGMSVPLPVSHLAFKSSFAHVEITRAKKKHVHSHIQIAPVTELGKVNMSHQKVAPSSLMSREGLWQNHGVVSINLSLFDMFILCSNVCIIDSWLPYMRRSEDKQEGAQWFASPQTLRTILETCLRKVSSLKGQALIVQHLTMYDGVFEKAGCCLLSWNSLLVNTWNVFLELGAHRPDEWTESRLLHCSFLRDTEPDDLPVCAHRGQRQIVGGHVCWKQVDAIIRCLNMLWNLLFQSLQEWKQGRGLAGQLQPKFQEKADLSDKVQPRIPQLKLCKMNEKGHLEIPRETRDKWLQDPTRRDLMQT